MPNRQEPLTVDMILHVCNLADRHEKDSLMEALRDWLIVGIYTGNRKSEWAQEHKIVIKGAFVIWDKQKGGDSSSKAFTQKDMVFLGKNGKHFYASDSAIVDDDEVEFMEIRYRFQENKDNGQKINYSKSTNTKLCPVREGLKIRRRA
eukprot:10689151-Ditylum_brightwellii.AAC.1